MVIKEESSQGVTLELQPEEAAELVASLETHTFVSVTAAELDQRLKEAGVTATDAAPPEEPSPDMLLENQPQRY